MTVTEPREPTIELGVSWDGSGNYDGPHDNLVGRLKQATLATTRGRADPRGSGGPMASTMSAVLYNEDRLLSNEYPGSDLYLLVEPGKPTRVRMTAGAAVDYDEAISYDEEIAYDGVTSFPVVTGYLEEPEADSARGNKVLSISALGTLSLLRGGAKISTALHSGITVGQAVAIILNHPSVNWPVDARRIAAGDTTLDWWWLDEADPLDALDDLLVTEGVPAYMGEDAAGWIVFENRNHRANAPRSLVSQATFSDQFGGLIDYEAPIDYDEPVIYDGVAGLYHSGIQVQPRRADVVNEATVRIVRRVPQSLRKVYEYGEALTLLANETLDVTVTFADPCIDVTAPASGTDYTVSAGALASAPTLVTIYAQRAVVRFAAGSSGATVIGVTSNGFQVRAQPVVVLSEETVTDDIPARPIDQPPPTGRGVKAKQIAALPELSRPMALAVANAEVLYSRDPRPIVTFTVMNIDGAHLHQQLYREIGDRVTALSAHHGLAGGSELTIEQIQHQRQAGLLVTTFVCQRAYAERGTGIWAASDADTTPGVALWGANDSDTTPGVGKWSP